MISVIVCTYNRLDTLRRMLTSFFAQASLESVDYELIVVDNNSTDGTRALAHEFEQYASLSYVFEARQGLSCARNRGVAESHGDIVAFLDDDVIVDRNWLRKLKKCFDESNADVVGGRSYLVFEQDPPQWLGSRFQTWLSKVDHGSSRIPVQGGLYGLNLSFRKSTLLDTGGFNEDLGRKGRLLFAGEEEEVIQKIRAAGGSIYYDPDVVVGHIVGPERIQWGYFRRSAMDRGRQHAAGSRGGSLVLRVKNALRATCSVIAVMVELCRRRGGARDSYEQRWAWRGFWGTIGYFREQWRQVFSPR